MRQEIGGVPCASRREFEDRLRYALLGFVHDDNVLRLEHDVLLPSVRDQLVIHGDYLAFLGILFEPADGDVLCLCSRPETARLGDGLAERQAVLCDLDLPKRVHLSDHIDRRRLLDDYQVTRVNGRIRFLLRGLDAAQTVHPRGHL